jgi:hypothetical protein
MGEPAQELVAPVMMDYSLADHGAETCHAVGEPWRHAAAMERQIGASGTARHSVESHSGMCRF